MKIITEIPSLVADIFREDSMAGRRQLMNAGYTEYDAKYYTRLFKDADVRYGIDEATTKAVLFPDIQYPFHNRKCIDVVFEFCEDYQPDFIVWLGDQLELEMLSYYNKSMPKSQVLEIKKDYDGFNVEILKPLEAICPNAEHIWFIGNHEYRAYRYIENYPQLKGLIEPEVVLNLENRGYEIVGFNKEYKLGKLRLMHGIYWNMYHARKTVDDVMHSVVYGHVHSPQMFTKVSSVDHKNYYIAYSLPCLCTLNPAWKRNKPNHWVNGFGIVEIFDDRNFNVYMPIINNGRFAWNGKVYQ